MVLLIHGGGWAFGSIEEMEPTARHLAAESGAVVVSTSYRLAPENPYPAGLKDCEATLRWILAEGRKHGGDPSRLAIGGASAGGNLAAAVAMRAPPGTFKAQLLFYGVLGNSFETASYREFGDGRFGLSRDRMKMFFDIYVGKADANDPAITPMNGDLTSAPPAWICAAECDVLHDDSVQFYEKLRALARRRPVHPGGRPEPRLHQPRPAPAAGEDDDRERGGFREGEGVAITPSRARAH